MRWMLMMLCCAGVCDGRCAAVGALHLEEASFLVDAQKEANRRGHDPGAKVASAAQGALSGNTRTGTRTSCGALGVASPLRCLSSCEKQHRCQSSAVKALRSMGLTFGEVPDTAEREWHPMFR